MPPVHLTRIGCKRVVLVIEMIRLPVENQTIGAGPLLWNWSWIQTHPPQAGACHECHLPYLQSPNGDGFSALLLTALCRH